MPSVDTILEKLTDGEATVNIKEFPNRLAFLRAVQVLDNTSYQLASDTVTDNRDITLNDATGLLVGDEIALILGNGSLNPSYYYGVIKVKTTNTLTMDTPVDIVYPAGTTEVYKLNTNLNLNATPGTPIVARTFNASSELELSIKRMLIHVTDDAAMDDTTFGGIPELNYGISLRKKNADGTFINYFNVTTNGELRELAYDVEYVDKAGPGLYGLGCRLTFTKMGSPIVLQEGEELQVILQDDLTGLSSLEIMFEGELIPLIRR